jgi:hypothetical protein
MAVSSQYVRGEQLTAAAYKEKPTNSLFWYKPSNSAPWKLVKVYKKNGSPSVAIMDAHTHKHVGYPSIERLYRAHLVVSPAEDEFARLFSKLHVSRHYRDSDDSDSDSYS